MTVPHSITADAIVADPRGQLPLAHRFLGAYFHEDWSVDSAHWEDAVDEFAADSSRPTVTATVGELRHLAAAGLDDRALRDVLANLDCSLDPAGIGLDAQTWIATVAERLDS